MALYLVLKASRCVLSDLPSRAVLSLDGALHPADMILAPLSRVTKPGYGRAADSALPGGTLVQTLYAIVGSLDVASGYAPLFRTWPNSCRMDGFCA